MMVHFYTDIIMKSICTSYITICWAAARAQDEVRLQRIVRCAREVIGFDLPALQDLYASRTLRWAGDIGADPPTLEAKLRPTRTSSHKNRAAGLVNTAQHIFLDCYLCTLDILSICIYCIYMHIFSFLVLEMVTVYICKKMVSVYFKNVV